MLLNKLHGVWFMRIIYVLGREKVAFVIKVNQWLDLTNVYSKRRDLKVKGKKHFFFTKVKNTFLTIK